MKITYFPLYRRLIFFLLLVPDVLVHAQHDTLYSMPGPEYKKGLIHNVFLGFHHRKTWTTPVKAPVLDLEARDLKPEKRGGSRESTSLRMTDSRGHEWVARSVNKDLSKALLNGMQRLFLSGLAKDFVSGNYPYAPLIVSPLARAAGIPHSTPHLYAFPDDPRLGKHREEFAHMLVMLEERPDESWKDTSIFLNSDDIKGTDKLFEDRLEDNKTCFDTDLYLRCRMLDMLIGDWSRHGDQYRWIDNEDMHNEHCEAYYLPVPRDRDHAFFRNDGVINAFVRLFIPKMLTFDKRIKSVRGLTYNGWELDRIILMQSAKEQYIEAARHLQSVITDEVIREGLNRIPQEARGHIYSRWEKALRSRRDMLHEAAADFYDILAKDAYITGTAKKELFQVVRLENKTRVTLFAVKKDGSMRTLFLRDFEDNETKTITLLGLEHDDTFQIAGDKESKITVIIMGGPGEDIVEYLPDASRNRINVGHDIKEASYNEHLVREVLKK